MSVAHAHSPGARPRVQGRDGLEYNLFWHAQDQVRTDKVLFHDALSPPRHHRHAWASDRRSAQARRERRERAAGTGRHKSSSHLRGGNDSHDNSQHLTARARSKSRHADPVVPLQGHRHLQALVRGARIISIKHHNYRSPVSVTGIQKKVIIHHWSNERKTGRRCAGSLSSKSSHRPPSLSSYQQSKRLKERLAALRLSDGPQLPLQWQRKTIARMAPSSGCDAWSDHAHAPMDPPDELYGADFLLQIPASPLPLMTSSDSDSATQGRLGQEFCSLLHARRQAFIGKWVLT